MTDLQKRLYELCDENYAAFQAKLTPTVPPALFIGVRVPILRTFAKSYMKEPQHETFLLALPHHYYDENMLHALLLSEVRDYSSALTYVEAFLPYVDNWSVCDILSPKVFKKHKGDLIGRIPAWVSSGHVYTCRFGIEVLMSHYLDADFLPEYLEIPVVARSDEYYVKMMVAWFYATALAKQWESTIPYIEQQRLASWTHNKTIQKACESYRITPEQKEYLKSLKVKGGSRQ